MFCKVVFDVPLDRDFDYIIPPALESKVRPGVRVTAPFGHRLTCGLVVSVSEITSVAPHIQLKEIVYVVDDSPLFGADLLPLMRFMKNNWGCPVGQILFSLVPPQPYYKKLPFNAPTSVMVARPNFTLTETQQQVLDKLHNFPKYTFHALLLQGSSFSGKTEVILRYAGDVLSSYGQVLITVPDIVAARQFINEALARFGEENVFCWHSRMLLSKKKKYFSAISNGAPCVVIATRSGVLLPFKNLRFTAMLDEGSENYKQEENKPYYHARDVLFFRAKMHESILVYASNTPSAELLYQVQRGEIEQIKFTNSLPNHRYSVQIQLTPKKGTQSRFVSDELLKSLEENLHRKEISLLILNRRGYANGYACVNCGAYAVCKKCGAILVREKSAAGPDQLVCKECGAKETLEQTCAKCQNVIFKSRGAGTQKIATEIQKLFPQAHILRLDSDSLKTKDGQGFEALKALRNGKADVIIGTRIASGALRGARVTLAAVLDAELELNGTDFRLTEKYTQMLFDLRGHLAAHPNGHLIIQTADAEKYDYEPLLKNDFQMAAETELLLRESFNYPPYCHLIRVTVKAKDFDLLNKDTARLKSLATQGTEVLGPVWCAKKTDTLKKQYLLFKTTRANYLDLLAQLDSFVPSNKVTVQLTADPYTFY